MAELVARGPEEQDGCRWTLAEGSVTLGRVASKSTWVVPWDPLISGMHATLTWQEGRLSVRRAPESRNHILYRKQPSLSFTLVAGESFVIGKTTFTLVDEDEAPPTPVGKTPDLALSCSSEELRQFKYADADQRIEVLAELPDVIRLSPSDEELEKSVLDVLLRGIPRAGAVFVVRLKAPEDEQPEVRARAARSAALEEVPPSRRLIAEALRAGQSVLYRWDLKSKRGDFTAAPAFDWALCAPLPGDPAPGWGLYVAGRLRGHLPGGSDPAGKEFLKSDLKFAEAAAAIFGALRQVRELQAQQAHVRASLQVAKEIQAGFFPRTLPEVPGYELAAASRAADETGGDYYDVLPLPSGRIGLVVADVCGHGLGPSLLMASVRAALRGLAVRDPEPEALLGDLNQAMYADLTPRRRFITLLYGALDPVAHSFHYANAGHGPVVLHVRPAQGTVHTLVDDEARGCPIGVLREPYRACTPVEVAPGDLLVLGTDGIPESRRGAEQFGMKRLADFILDRLDRPLQQTIEALMAAAAAFHEHDLPDDDLTLMIVRRL